MKVARPVLRRAALGNWCRLSDKSELENARLYCARLYSRNKRTFHYFRPLEAVPICQTMGIFYVRVWLYVFAKSLKAGSCLCQTLHPATSACCCLKQS